MGKRDDLLFKKNLKVSLLGVMPIALAYILIFNSKLTGFATQTDAQDTMIVSGIFLGSILLFFIILLILIKIKK